MGRLYKKKYITRVAQTHVTTHTKGEPCQWPTDPFVSWQTILETSKSLNMRELQL